MRVDLNEFAAPPNAELHLEWGEAGVVLRTHVEDARVHVRVLDPTPASPPRAMRVRPPPRAMRGVGELHEAADGGLSLRLQRGSAVYEWALETTPSERLRLDPGAVAIEAAVSREELEPTTWTSSPLTLGSARGTTLRLGGGGLKAAFRPARVAREGSSRLAAAQWRAAVDALRAPLVVVRVFESGLVGLVGEGLSVYVAPLEADAGQTPPQDPNGL